MPHGVQDLKEISENKNRIQTIKNIAQQWAEPFRSMITQIPDTTNVKQLDLEDFAPRPRLRSIEKVILVGDAFHAMTMCKSSPK